jgi:hypothetical protein
MLHIDWFWLFILCVSVAAILVPAVRVREREKTIRTAIEKGVTLDPATMDALRLQPSAQGNPRFGMTVGAIMTFFIGIGLGLMGALVHFGEIIWPLVGVMAFMWCISAGLLVASRFAPPSR